VLILLLVSFFAFVMVRLIPGDPATIMLGVEASEESIAAARESLGLNRGILPGYADWLLKVVRGNLGTSF
jgi:peptide/nickel transport system permease protein